MNPELFADVDRYIADLLAPRVMPYYLPYESLDVKTNFRYRQCLVAITREISRNASSAVSRFTRASADRHPRDCFGERYSALKRRSLRSLPSAVMDEPSGVKEYQEEGFQALWLPITGGKPPSVEQVKQFVNFAEPIISDNHSVVVHCTSGNRRTGTLLAAYLIAKGENPKQAILMVQKARPTAELREAQRNFLFQLPELLAN